MRHGLTDQDPLWVPLLTHYQPDGRIDGRRMTSHLNSVAQHVRQIMVAGSTGDGWELDDERYAEVVEWALGAAPKEVKVIFGALRPDTESVISRIRMIEQRIAHEAPIRRRYVGVTVCPPVKEDASQDEIVAHYRAILMETESDVALYQLPQVTGCTLSAETVEALSSEPRIIMFKDSSGTDEVTSDARDLSQLLKVRGAEGGYVEAVITQRYDGWLLSTANAFGEELRQIEELIRNDRNDEARQLSGRLSDAVGQLFEAAAQEAGANAFSNANRAADHIAAFGRHWRDVPLPLKQDGTRLSRGLAERAFELMESLYWVREEGYLRA